MALTLEALDTLSSRLAQLANKSPDEDTLRELLRLRQELTQCRGRQTGSPETTSKLLFLRRYLTVKPVSAAVPASARLAEIVRGFEGRLWSRELLASLDAELAALTRDQQIARERCHEVEDEVRSLRRQCDNVRAYIGLLDALAGKKGSAA